MKFVRKAGAPHAYRAWRKTMKGQPNEDFPHGLQNPLKKELHDALLHEQGYLCAYTMKRVGYATSHIEHIKPESVCREELRGSDLDYENMVACFPKEGMETAYRYGAQKRGSWWDNDGAEFITPLNQACERCFRFDREGKIAAINRHAAAEKTIKKLGLDHDTLIEDRKLVINEFIHGPHGKDPISIPQAEAGMASMGRRNGAGEFPEFCVAICQALEDHVATLAKIAQKKKFIPKK